MIILTEQESRKVSGATSLFFKINYNKEIVTLLQSIGSYYFHKKETLWEFPLFKLSDLIDKLSQFDEITFIPLEAEPQKDSSAPAIEDIDFSQLKTDLFDYQKESVCYGLQHDKWLLLDAPGLGKSLQVIALAQMLKNLRKINHCLIICGIATLKQNWVKEISKHSNLDSHILGEKVSTRTQKRTVGSIPERVMDIKSNPKEFFWITNVETLRDNRVIAALKEQKVDMIVFDEIHVCKSDKSAQGGNLLKLESKYQVGLTGTLYLNSPLDSYVPLKWIGKEKSTLTTFKSQYIKYAGFNGIQLGYQNLDYLRHIINSCSLRRNKDQLDLPPKTIIHEYVEMSEEESKLYNEVLTGVLEDINKVKINSVNILSILIRLRQALSCPKILTTKQIESSKISRACQLAEEIIANNDKVIIYSSFKETVYDIAKRLSHQKPLIITGDQSDHEISTATDKFQTDDENKVIVATWQKAGTGLTLTKARYIIFVDCSWVPSQNEQAEDRIHRVGTTEPVFIYYLWALHTIDDRIKAVNEDKSLVIDYTLNEDDIPQQLQARLAQLVYDYQHNILD